MQKVKKRFANGEGGFSIMEFDIYTKEEADSLGICYLYWRDVDKDTQKLSWIISDDNFVFQVWRLKPRDISNGKRFKQPMVFITPVFGGQVATNRRDKFLFESPPLQRKHRTKFFDSWRKLSAQIVAQAIIHGADPVRSTHVKVPTLSGYSRPLHEALRESDFRSMVTDSIKAHFSRRGLTTEVLGDKIIDLMKDAETHTGSNGKKTIGGMQLQLNVLKMLYEMGVGKEDAVISAGALRSPQDSFFAGILEQYEDAELIHEQQSTVSAEVSA